MPNPKYTTCEKCFLAYLKRDYQEHIAQCGVYYAYLLQLNLLTYRSLPKLCRVLIDGTITVLSTDNQEAVQVSNAPQSTYDIFRDTMLVDNTDTEEHDYGDEELRIWPDRRQAGGARDIDIDDANCGIAENNENGDLDDSSVVADDNDDNNTDDNYSEFEDDDTESYHGGESNVPERSVPPTAEAVATVVGEDTVMGEGEPPAYVDPWEKEPPLPIDTPIIQTIRPAIPLQNYVHMSYELYSWVQQQNVSRGAYEALLLLLNKWIINNSFNKPGPHVIKAL